MRRAIVPFLAGFALVALVIGSLVGGIGIVHTAQAGMFQTTGASATPTSGSGTPTTTPRWMLPPQLQFLSSETPQQRFDSFTGAQASFVNPSGQSVVVNMIPGKVSTLTGTSLVLTPNGSSTTRTFGVTTSTYVQGSAHQGTLSAFTTGDRVLVVTINNSSDATAILQPHEGFMGYGAYPHRYPGHNMPPAGTPSAAATVTATPTGSVAASGTSGTAGTQAVATATPVPTDTAIATPTSVSPATATPSP